MKKTEGCPILFFALEKSFFYEQVPTKSKDQADSLNAFSVIDDSRNNNKKVNVQQGDISNNI